MESNPTLEAKSTFQELKSQFPGRFSNGQLRTLQRRFADWRHETNILDRLEDWLLCLLQGKVNEAQLKQIPAISLQDEDLALFLHCIRCRGIRSRNRAVVILANMNNIPIPIICKTLKLKQKTVCRYIQRYKDVGAKKLFNYERDIVKKADRKEYKDALFSILHEPPSLYGINRTRWEMADIKGVMYQKGFKISLLNIRQILRNAGYKFRKARKVLTSNDPKYREKLQRITSILSNLQPDERFFSVDEFGPFSVKLIGGRSLMSSGNFKTIPQYQKSKGSLILTAALELKTNQIPHFYSPAQHSTEIIRLLDMLILKYHETRKIYFSWDAASWHASKKLKKYVNEHNELLKLNKLIGPQVRLAPLPARAQFLNVIESVFSGMARAVIHNSNYDSVDSCKEAIDLYIAERNKHFIENPRRAGKKIWGDELVKPIFNVANNCKNPRW